NTIYLSTFSKTLAPGIRLGWIVAPERVILKFVQAKQGADLHSGTFVQYVAADICNRGLLKRHVKYIRQMYHERRDMMLAAMEKYFPPGVTWTRPQGGLFLWVILPKHVDTEKLLQIALKEEKVAFVPGTAFYPAGDRSGLHCMRLNFSNAPLEMIEEGIKRLGKVMMREFG
ncbi:MAG: aminotransferase, partial [Chloroflexi bacterium]